MDARAVGGVVSVFGLQVAGEKRALLQARAYRLKPLLSLSFCFFF